MNNTKQKQPLAGLLAAGLLTLTMHTFAADQVTVVERPDISGTNSFYVSNRKPLEPSRFIPLPVGSIQPGGWVKAFLVRQKEGLTGHLGEISAWLQKEDNAWLSRDGKGKYGWEELPYWLRGYIDLAYIFDDPKMIAESQTWVNGALASQRPDGDFGPDHRFEDGTRDYWANMVMLFCLQSYYDKTSDPRVLELMSKYFKHQYSVPDEKLLTGYWQRMRGGDNLYSIHWLYNRTGDPELLKVAEKIHKRTANWKLPNDLPNWHNVNIAECFREPAQFFLQTHDQSDLEAAYNNFKTVRTRYGQVPGGMFGSDENCRPGYDDPRQAVETCGMVEQMLSDEILLHISGDPFWADHCEEVAFNTYPAAVMPDFRALRYLTAPNMVSSDRLNHSPGVENAGPFMMMNPFSSRCCQHNHSHGWPFYNKNLWMATPDNGICAMLYSESEARAKVGNGANVRFIETTRYPFEESVQIALAMDKASTFPLYLRIPAWCKAPKIAVNGKQLDVASSTGKYVRISREWKDSDKISIDFPMNVTVRRWQANHDSVSVNYGPLTFSLKIDERYDKFDSAKTAIGDSHWQKNADPSEWPSFEIHPVSDWNYGLVLNDQAAEKSFEVQKGSWPADNFPFTTGTVPIALKAKARQIPEWTKDRFGLCAPLQDSPAYTTQPVKEVTLIPMGAARLRISAFPTVSDSAPAKRWEKPVLPKPAPYTLSASHVNDALDALCDGILPQNSGDHEVPRFTWWPHLGGTEWVQYEFESEKNVSGVSVYWFDDTGRGQCRVPDYWSVLYNDGTGWKPVQNKAPYTVRRDAWNEMSIQPVKTKALRLQVKLQDNFSGGILEWQVK